MGKTNFDQITASPEVLAAFLTSLPCLDAPWDDAFHRVFVTTAPWRTAPRCARMRKKKQPCVVAVTFTRSEPMKNRDNAGLHIENRQIQYIARISHGKDSMKMLDVIISRGLKLDRITTTDIWATETIRGEYPEMVKFKERADEYIWQKYRIEVEHLCAMRNGEKQTYEKLFYHVPKRKSAGGH